jgi:hypothetical protein
MGTFTETAVVDYRLMFADQGKQTSVFRFRSNDQMEACRFPFLFAANKLKLPFSAITHAYKISKLRESS